MRRDLIQNLIVNIIPWMPSTLPYYILKFMYGQYIPGKHRTYIRYFRVWVERPERTDLGTQKGI